nr:hypothetical protein Iba_chr03bCG5130 [Ipomoea batatas]
MELTTQLIRRSLAQAALFCSKPPTPEESPSAHSAPPSALSAIDVCLCPPSPSPTPPLQEGEKRSFFSVSLTPGLQVSSSRRRSLHYRSPPLLLHCSNASKLKSAVQSTLPSPSSISHSGTPRRRSSCRQSRTPGRRRHRRLSLQDSRLATNISCLRVVDSISVLDARRSRRKPPRERRGLHRSGGVQGEIHVVAGGNPHVKYVEVRAELKNGVRVDEEKEEKEYKLKEIEAKIVWLEKAFPTSRSLNSICHAAEILHRKNSSESFSSKEDPAHDVTGGTVRDKAGDCGKL